MFQQKKNRQFNYRSRFSKDEEANTYKDITKEKMLKRPVRKSRTVKLPLLVIILVIFIVMMWYLDRKMN